jgi:hypothetical protein
MFAGADRSVPDLVVGAGGPNLKGNGDMAIENFGPKQLESWARGYARETASMASRDDLAYPQLVAFLADGTVESGVYDQATAGAWHQKDGVVFSIPVPRRPFGVGSELYYAIADAYAKRRQ